MTDSLDCNWVEAHFEALLSDGLEPDEERLVREHMGSCRSCRHEMEALRAIDPLVKRHFQRGLAASQSPRVAHTGRLLGVSTAALALVGILLFVILRAPQTTPAAPAQTVEIGRAHV